MVALEQSEVFLLNQEQRKAYWDLIEGLLDNDRQPWRNWHSKEGILKKINDEHIQVWAVCEKDGPVDAILLTQILVGELGKALELFLDRGRFIRWGIKMYRQDFRDLCSQYWMLPSICVWSEGLGTEASEIWNEV